MSQYRNKYSPYIQYRGNLQNTYNKLTQKKKLNVVFLGGSVTHGHSASDLEKWSWRALTGAFLQKRFPDAQINLYDTARGESGTFLGTYRLERDILSHKPDLFIIEYAINDSYHLGMLDDEFEDEAARRYETIIREVRSSFPECDIFGLIITDKILINTYPEDNMFPAARGHARIAKEYGISMLNAGLALHKTVDLISNWYTYFYDNAHPIDAGHMGYFECIEEYLYNELICPEAVAAYGKEIIPHNLRDIVSDSLFDGNRTNTSVAALRGGDTHTTTRLVDTTFEYSSEPFDEPNQYYGYYFAKSPEQYITFEFSGTEIALWTLSYSRKGNENILVSIDGGDFFEMPLSNYNPTLIDENLESGIHTVTVKPTFSSGNYDDFKIGSVFTRDSSLETKKQ